MNQRLGLADVLITEPEIIVLDEPTIGIDPKGINEFLEMIRNWSKEQDITVLLSSHLLHQVQKICDRVGILVDGQLSAEGNIQKGTLNDEFITMKGKKEAAPVISETIGHHDVKLYQLSYQEYGLDDIYQHYFKGGEGYVN